MEKMTDLYTACKASPAYIHLPKDADIMEGFVNGWAWAQGMAKECLALRKLPAVWEDYGPGQKCGTCGWFVQHFRYTSSAPWYALVDCGHCFCPDVERGKGRRDPLWRGCRYWKEAPQHE